MVAQTIDISCPGCGASVSVSQKVCEYCFRPIIVSTYNSVASMPMPEINKYTSSYRKSLSDHPNHKELNLSIGICYLKLKMYDEAYAALSKAIQDNFDNSEIYFYAAAALMKGKKAFLHTRPEIDKILELLNAANMIEPRGIYYYFMAYIKYDYFKRKFLNSTPDYKSLLSTAQSVGYSSYDVLYINAHGTGTPLNDPLETEAFKIALGDDAYKAHISSTKASTGHLLGAAGAVEAVASVMALKDGIVPPTINLDAPDPDCDLNYTPNNAVRADLTIAISDSLGFGGHNACVAFRKL